MSMKTLISESQLRRVIREELVDCLNEKYSFLHKLFSPKVQRQKTDPDEGPGTIAASFADEERKKRNDRHGGMKLNDERMKVELPDTCAITWRSGKKIQRITYDDFNSVENLINIAIASIDDYDFDRSQIPRVVDVELETDETNRDIDYLRKIRQIERIIATKIMSKLSKEYLHR